MNPVNNVKMLKVMKKIPSDLKIKAKGLLLFFKDNKIIDWNSNGEIYVNSKIINKSNIIKLITHALTNNKEKPIGYKKIYGEIKNFKIPSYLNANNLKKYTKKTETNEWRPPGLLYKEENH